MPHPLCGSNSLITGENTGNISSIAGVLGVHPQPKGLVFTRISLRIPHSTEQGNLKREQGIISAVQGIFFEQQGYSSSAKGQHHAERTKVAQLGNYTVSDRGAAALIWRGSVFFDPVFGRRHNSVAGENVFNRPQPPLRWVQSRSAWSVASSASSPVITNAGVKFATDNALEP